MSLVVVTLAVGYAPWIVDMVRNNRDKWCKQQGLEYRFYDKPLLSNQWPTAWHKLPAMLQEVRAGNDVLWLDADAAILARIPVEVLKTNIACAKDNKGWNTGVLYIPSSHAWVLESMLSLGTDDISVRNHKWWEQRAFHILYDSAKLPHIDELDADIWNSRTSMVIRHWAGHATIWPYMMRDVCCPLA